MMIPHYLWRACQQAANPKVENEGIEHATQEPEPISLCITAPELNTFPDDSWPIQGIPYVPLSKQHSFVSQH